MKSLRFLERGKSRKAMKIMKVRRKSSYSMGTAKCMRVRRTNKIHSWAVSVGTSMIGAGSSSNVLEGTSVIVGKIFCVPKRPHGEKHEDVC